MSLKLTLRGKARNVLVAAALSGSLFGTAPVAQAETTLKVVMQSGLRILDPIMTTAYLTRDHGYMIYDTLLGKDEHYEPRPQMASWQVSEDQLTYTFTLRDGLRWHDGTPVTAEDCIASINRWGGVDAVGQVLMTMVKSMDVVDAKQFKIVLNQPTPLVLDGLSKISSRPAFMMPKRIADTPASQAITEYIGSGPFKFVAAAFKPGLQVVYEKNQDYVPRGEPPSWLAGGKRVNVDRVVWEAMPDQMTAVNALQNGEVDYVQQVPFDLLPVLANQPGVKVDVLDQLGSWTYFRVNHLYPPFDNKLVRQAAMAAVGQEDVLKALVGDPQYYRPCAAVLGCGGPMGDNYGADWVIPSRIDKAKALLAEAKYDGTPVVVLQPTDMAMVAAQPVVIGAALRKAGFNVKMKTVDWQSVVAQQANQNSPQEGGWNVMSTYSILAATGDPISNGTLVANGRKGWAGWPDVPEMEALRLKYAQTTDTAERKQIAARIQQVAIDEGIVAPLGQFQIPSAYSTKLTDVLRAPITVFWNLKKADK